MQVNAAGRTGKPADVVAAAIIDAGQPPRLLAAQRAYPPSLRGYWELPGGKVEAGEDYLLALQREIREELGCRIRCARQLENAAHADGAWPILGGRRMFVWIAHALDTPALSADHLALQWCTASNYRQLQWLAPNLPIVEALWRTLR